MEHSLKPSYKIAFVFPGQGSQETGMGLDLYQNYSLAKKIFQKADQLFNQSISELCFYGDNEKLKNTNISQVAIFTTSIATFEVLSQYITPDIVAGHSVGEYSALVASGVLDFESCFELVKFRGELMYNVSKDRQGVMCAILKFDETKLEELCKKYNKGVVSIANYNTQDQLVISGDKSAVEDIANTAKNMGARRIIPLRVGGAFHSLLMKDAAVILNDKIDKTKFNNANIPVVTNIDAEITIKADEFKTKLQKQLISPVQWYKTIKNMLHLGVDTFIEVGHGKVLTNIIRNIDRSVKVFNVSDKNSLENML